MNLTEPASTTVLVDYQTHGLTAFDDSDFYGTNGTLSFSPGEMTNTIRVYATNDSLVERDEAFQLELSNPVGASFHHGKQSVQAIGWVLDDDAGGGQRSLAVSSPVVDEGRNVKAEFVVSVSEAFATSTTLTYATFPGSAGSRDFAERTGTVTFAPGQTEAVVPVRIHDDRAQEPGEVFGLKVTGGGLAATGSASILNDDRPAPVISLEGDRTHEGGYATFTARLSQPATSAVSVAYQTLDGSATHGVDFYDTSGTLTFAAGETTKTVRVYAVNDSLGEHDEAFQLDLFNPVGAVFGGGNHDLDATAWIIDEDAGGGQRALSVSQPVMIEGKSTATFTVGISEAFASDTRLKFATVAGSALAGSDFAASKGALTFLAGQTEAEVNVKLKDGHHIEATESFGLKVKGAGLAGFGEARILDDDSGRPIASVETAAAIEGHYETFVVRLSHAAKGEVTVGYETLSRTALAGSDFYSTSGDLTFHAGETTHTVRVYAVNDSASESDEFFDFRLSNAVGARFAPGDPVPTATGMVLDNDPGFQKRVLAVSDVRVSEDGGNADFRVDLSRALDHDLVLRFKTFNGSAKASDYDRGHGKLTIAAGQTEAVIGVGLTNDHRVEGTETFGLKLLRFDHRDFAPSGSDVQATAYIVNDDARAHASSALHDYHDFLM